MPEPEKLPLDKEKLRKLGTRLHDKFALFERDKRGVETQWLKNLRQFLGEYDPEIEGKFEPQQSRAYPKVTRVKVVSMVSRLMEMLFPAGEKNWGVTSSPSPHLEAEQLQQVVDTWLGANPGREPTDEDIDRAVREFAIESATRMEREIDDQMGDLGVYGALNYADLVRKVVFSAVLYSVGVLKGPMTIAMDRARYVKDPLTGQYITEQYTSYRPYGEAVSVWDWYPDLSAKTFDQMDGQFYRHVFSRHYLRKLADRSDFMGDAIQKYLNTHQEGNYKRRNFESELLALGKSHTNEVTLESRRYEVLEWWGYVYGSDLRAAGVEVPDNKLNEEMHANVWTLDGVVIKAVKAPFREGVNMFHQFVFEEDEVNLCGSGLPPIVRDSQMAIASGARMLMDNASVTAGPSAEFDADLLKPGQDMTIRPFAIYEKEDGVSDKQAVRPISFDSHMGDLLRIIETFKSFADQETFVNPATGGDFSGVPSEAMRTTGGASMILGAAALPFRDVVRNFDRFTVSFISALIEWNMLFNDRADIIGDMRPVARGATSLMAKELRANTLDNLATTLTEKEWIYVDEEKLVQQRLAVRDLGPDLLVTKEVAEQRKAQQSQQAQEQADAQKQLIAAQVKDLLTGALKNASQARKNLDAADVALFDSVLKAITEGVNPDDVTQFTRSSAAGIAGAGTAPVQQPDIAGTPDVAAALGQPGAAPLPQAQTG